jgi:hypothetical protein
MPARARPRRIGMDSGMANVTSPSGCIMTKRISDKVCVMRSPHNARPKGSPSFRAARPLGQSGHSAGARPQEETRGKARTLLLVMQAWNFSPKINALQVPIFRINAGHYLPSTGGCTRISHSIFPACP